MILCYDCFGNVKTIAEDRMQITPVNIPVPPQSPNQTQTIANGLQHVAVQATTPTTHNAVAASQKDEGGSKAKERRKDRRNPKGEQMDEPQDQEAQDRGENLNLSV